MHPGTQGCWFSLLRETINHENDIPISVPRNSWRAHDVYADLLTWSVCCHWFLGGPQFSHWVIDSCARGAWLTQSYHILVTTSPPVMLTDSCLFSFDFYARFVRVSVEKSPLSFAREPQALGPFSCLYTKRHWLIATCSTPNRTPYHPLNWFASQDPTVYVHFPSGNHEFERCADRSIAHPAIQLHLMLIQGHLVWEKIKKLC